MNNTELAIAAYGVRKQYKGNADGAGLNGFNLEVRKGAVRGLLGPNGAGKTTAVKILSTLLGMDAGEATVAGFNVTTQAHLVREKIGLVGQYAAVDEVLTGRQNLELFGRLNHLSAKEARKRADELLERFGLTQAGNTPADKYSGGMRRRLDLAASLIVSPSVLFVDEPTTGLDPLARKEVWEAIRSLADAGTTVLLTTQYLEEADRLADEISMLKAGVIVAEGTPEQLKSAIGGDRLEIVLDSEADTKLAITILRQIASANLSVDEPENRISAPVSDRTGALMKVAAALMEARVEPKDISLRRPTLDEVFIHLTGATAPYQNEEANS
ncbi:ATP-binding cassette domain-containing protein [Paenibacillus hemerocallicola]|uniref:ATP-binding cassette domain-containing protein n=1 Tax=Paenibacillus hemerocallicola TaxID=1172614 RepID=A0A5C4T6X7_9BACL|nr:ATP-binding cassette domain-containing protein [Paenibacillus hemerocallicola]TNJ64823.1 ATP-binding cassette domain-containing protein [Paenibacillus hemerocallicola]